MHNLLLTNGLDFWAKKTFVLPHQLIVQTTYQFLDNTQGSILAGNEASCLLIIRKNGSFVVFLKKALKLKIKGKAGQEEKKYGRDVQGRKFLSLEVKDLANGPQIACILCQIVAAKRDYNNINFRKAKKISQRMFYYTLPTAPEPIHNLIYYYLPESYGYYLPQHTYLLAPHTTSTPITPNYNEQLSPQPFISFSKTQSLISLKSEISETIEGPSESRPVEKVQPVAVKTVYKKCQKLGIQEIKLDFRIQWKNQNRNIVPNLVNQMMSFLLKKNKSQKLINKLFDYYGHEPSWTANKFYLYMKKIKDSISHYVNESVIQYFFQVHEPKCQIYQEEEQQFYMKLCRIAIITFLRNDAIIISLTSTRMSEAKRKTHLIAREALLKKFLELARY